MRIVSIIFLLIATILPEAHPQDRTCSPAFKSGEKANYDIYFKWGLVMMRAGEGVFSYDNTAAVSGTASRYRLTFKTTRFFDGIFRMRDTLDCHYDDACRLIYSRKGSDEGGYCLTDELWLKHEADRVEVHSKRYTPTKLKIDTLMTATGEVSDMLGAIFYLRGIDRRSLKPGDRFPLAVAIGRDLVKLTFIYQNQAILERDNAKYSTRYFKIDIVDKAFETSKTSAEVWVGDDDNFLPVKVRAKLKIGNAEIHYRNAVNLAHPLASRVEMK